MGLKMEKKKKKKKSEKKNLKLKNKCRYLEKKVIRFFFSNHVMYFLFVYRYLSVFFDIIFFNKNECCGKKEKIKVEMDRDLLPHSANMDGFF